MHDSGESDSKYVILWEGPKGTERVDETDDEDEAERLVHEYGMAYGGKVWKTESYLLR